MQPGKMDRRITLKTVTETQDENGAPIQTLTILATVWAEVKPVRGFEGPEGSAEAARGEQIFKIRWMPGLTLKHQIFYTPYVGAAELVFDIVQIDEIGRQDGLELRAIAKVL